MASTEKDLISKAIKVMKNAYAPYSKFHVGVCLETESGKQFTGCNVENSSYGATICAERVAIGAAVASGEKGIKKIAIVSSSDRPCTPCGICRQVLAEFGPDTEIICTSVKGKKIEKFLLKNLLPHSFDKSFVSGNR